MSEETLTEPKTCSKAAPMNPLQPGAMRGDGGAGLKKQIPSSKRIMGNRLHEDPLALRLLRQHHPKTVVAVAIIG